MPKDQKLTGVAAEAEILEKLLSGARTLEGLLSELKSARTKEALLNIESARLDAENDEIEGQLRVRLDKLRAEQGKNDNTSVRSEISSIEDLLKQREEHKAEKLRVGGLREEPFFPREEYLEARKAFKDKETKELMKKTEVILEEQLSAILDTLLERATNIELATDELLYYTGEYVQQRKLGAVEVPAHPDGE